MCSPTGRLTRLPAGHQQHNQTATEPEHQGHNDSLTVGEIDIARLGWDPADLLTDFDYGTVTETRADGTSIREWNITAFDREIEIAPGVFFPAWTYNGRVPGPTLRANEGDLLRVHFVNAGTHPHTMHFHGIHSSFIDGVTGIGRGEIETRRQLHLRIRRQTVRAATSTTATPLRSSGTFTRGCTARSSSIPIRQAR